MSQPPKSKKRIVSKAEYVALRSKKASLSFSGTVLLITTWVVMVCGVFCCFGGLLVGIAGVFLSPPLGLLWIAFMLGMGYLIIRVGMFFSDLIINMMQRAEEMDIGVPFTQANTSDFPVAESLVRASAEPVQKQKDILLRASLQSQQTPAEQLLRSVEGQEA